MVDQESPGYRPRRAFVEPDAAPETPEPTPPASDGPPPAAAPEPPPTAGAGTPTPPATPEKAASAPPPSAPTTPPAASSPFAALISEDDDAPKPLYRDEVAGGAAAPTGPATPPTTARASDDTATRQINFAPRRPRNADDESTTILPRTSTGPRRPTTRDAIDDWDDEDEGRTPIGRRTRTALLVGAVAAIIVIGLAVFYAIGGFSGVPTAGPSASQSAPSSAAASSASPSASGGGDLLTPASMLTVDQAADLGGKTWTVKKSETAPDVDLNPACLGGDPVEGQPASQQVFTQVLGSSGKDAPDALHQATAYASPEDATQAFAIASKTLGGCPVTGSYIASGRTISGLGDQATGVVVDSVDGKDVQVHSVVASRTGRVVNILDVAQPDSGVSMTKVAKTLAAVVTTQCSAAGSTCDDSVKVKDGPPPLGGDEPGFLASGDLPPAKGQVSSWVGTAIELPKDDFAGSGCEVVSWTTLDSESKSSRVYIYSDSGNAFFGVNEIVLTLEDDDAATKLAGKIKDNIAGCKKRTLTATVTGPEKVSSVGAQNAEVTGWTSTITQKAVDGTQKYRVGVVSSGSKVVYTFLNPKGDYDFTDAQWDTVALRAGERATQVN